MAQAHGATVILPMGVEEARESILDMTEGAGADVVYDITGSPRVFASALALPRRFGRLVLLGDTGSPSAQYLTGDVVTKGLSILGAHDSNPPAQSTDHAYWSHQRMADLFYTYVLRGDMRVTDLITHRYSPADAPEAYRMLREQRATAIPSPRSGEGQGEAYRMLREQRATAIPSPRSGEGQGEAAMGVLFDWTQL